LQHKPAGLQNIEWQALEWHCNEHIAHEDDFASAMDAWDSGIAKKKQFYYLPYFS
jgi:hypothetical protein